MDQNMDNCDEADEIYRCLKQLLLDKKAANRKLANELIEQGVEVDILGIKKALSEDKSGILSATNFPCKKKKMHSQMGKKLGRYVSKSLSSVPLLRSPFSVSVAKCPPSGPKSLSSVRKCRLSVPKPSASVEAPPTPIQTMEVIDTDMDTYIVDPDFENLKEFLTKKFKLLSKKWSGRFCEATSLHQLESLLPEFVKESVDCYNSIEMPIEQDMDMDTLDLIVKTKLKVKNCISAKLLLWLNSVMAEKVCRESRHYEDRIHPVVLIKQMQKYLDTMRDGQPIRILPPPLTLNELKSEKSVKSEVRECYLALVEPEDPLPESSCLRMEPYVNLSNDPTEEISCSTKDSSINDKDLVSHVSGPELNRVMATISADKIPKRVESDKELSKGPLTLPVGPVGTPEERFCGCKKTKLIVFHILLKTRSNFLVAVANTSTRQISLYDPFQENVTIGKHSPFSDELKATGKGWRQKRARSEAEEKDRRYRDETINYMRGIRLLMEDCWKESGQWCRADDPSVDNSNWPMDQKFEVINAI